MRADLDVMLRPGEVRVGRRGWLRGRGAPSAMRTFVVSEEGREGVEPWRAAVERLTEALLELDVHGGALRLALSDHFVHYLLVPWSEKLVSDSERLAFARLSFSKVYGPLTDTWDVCMDDQPAGQASFACAVDRALVQALRRLATQRGLRLKTLTPAFAERVARHRRALNGEAFGLASVEPGRLTLAFRGEGGWSAIRSRRIDTPLSEALALALKQESAVPGAATAGTLYVAGEEVAQSPSLAVPGWKVTLLSEEAPLRPAAPRLASATR
jgi:hypothetical protein